MRILSLFIILILNMQFANAEIKYKTDRIKGEYEQLFEKNLELYQIVKNLEFTAKVWFQKDIIITEVYRTQKEQNKYYRGKKQFISPHQRWLAIDIRSRNFTKTEVRALVDIINKNSDYRNTYIPTAFYHDVGLGPHIHIQFKRRQ